MTAPDPTTDDVTAPTVEDVIAEAIHRAGCGCADWHPRDAEDPQYDEAAAAVVAAVRSMTVEQQAQLIGGDVIRAGFKPDGRHWRDIHDDEDAEHLTRLGMHIRVRLISPWRAEP